MLADIDAACTKCGCLLGPHAHLSGHAHNYQRFTRSVNKFDIPYVVCGNEEAIRPLSPIKGTPRTPVNVNPERDLRKVMMPRTTAIYGLW